MQVEGLQYEKKDGGGGERGGEHVGERTRGGSTHLLVHLGRNGSRGHGNLHVNVTRGRERGAKRRPVPEGRGETLRET